MKPMNAEAARRWRETRARGRTRYVLTIGVTWGTGMVLSLMAFDWLFEPQFSWRLHLLRKIVLYAVGGCILGLWMWSTAERRYGQFVEAQGSEE